MGAASASLHVCLFERACCCRDRQSDKPEDPAVVPLDDPLFEAYIEEQLSFRHTETQTEELLFCPKQPQTEKRRLQREHLKNLAEKRRQEKQLEQVVHRLTKEHA